MLWLEKLYEMAPQNFITPTLTCNMSSCVGKCQNRVELKVTIIWKKNNSFTLSTSWCKELQNQLLLDFLTYPLAHPTNKESPRTGVKDTHIVFGIFDIWPPLHHIEDMSTTFPATENSEMSGST